MGLIYGLATLLLAGGFASKAADATKTNAPAPAVVVNQLDDTTKIGIGDAISFRITEDRDQAKSLYVADSGELDVPYVGRVKAVNKTCRQLSAELKVLLEKDYYHVATPLLAIDRVGARNLLQVNVQGAVGRPGFIDIPPGEKPTISKVIQAAGGLSSMAKRDVVVTRTVEGAKQIIKVDMREILDRAKVEQDIQILPGDHIFVATKTFTFQ